MTTANVAYPKKQDRKPFYCLGQKQAPRRGACFAWTTFLKLARSDRICKALLHGEFFSEWKDRDSEVAGTQNPEQWFSITDGRVGELGKEHPGEKEISSQPHCAGKKAEPGIVFTMPGSTF